MNALAAITGESVVQSLIYLICIGMVFWLLNWLIDYVGLQDPVKKVAKVILAVALVLILIGILMSLAGHPIFR